MQPILPTINAALVKVIGVFSYTEESKLLFNQMGYQTLPIDTGEVVSNRTIEDHEKFVRDTYYAEFADLFFPHEKNQTNTPIFLKKEFEFDFGKKEKGEIIPIKARVINPELYFFSNSTGIFSLSFKIINKDFNYLSDITYCASTFDIDIIEKDAKLKFHEWISKNMLGGIKLRGENIETDKYSGSKFKVYTIIDVIEKDKENFYSREHLLYDIGTRSRIGTMGSNAYNAPSQQYFEELMQNNLNIFNNYQGLALLDSFTIIGNDIYPEIANFEFEADKQNTYNRIYFSMYVFNLFVRYSVFKFNATFSDDPIKKRDEFEEFLNNYNFKHVSFNFLPNIFFSKMRNSLNIEEEIDHFENRLQKFAGSIQEEQEKRQGILLGIISAISSIAAIEPALNYIEAINQKLQWPMGLLYFTLLLSILVLAIPILIYAFPTHYRRFKRELDKK